MFLALLHSLLHIKEHRGKNSDFAAEEAGLLKYGELRNKVCFFYIAYDRIIA